ncbi:MAG: DUF2946 family protein [Burkholderiaceae bacterium]|nr:DUF2946 family protein [Burkholderiaceae bacterium]
MHRHLTAWLAALALLIGSLLPVLSHAVVAQTAQDAQSWVEVCTVSGMAWVRALEVDTDQARASADHSTDDTSVPSRLMGACDGCSGHAPLLGVPPLAAVSLLPIGPAALPQAFLQAPRTLFVWVSAHSRAPPQLG